MASKLKPMEPIESFDWKFAAGTAMLVTVFRHDSWLDTAFITVGAWLLRGAMKGWIDDRRSPRAGSKAEK